MTQRSLYGFYFWMSVNPGFRIHKQAKLSQLELLVLKQFIPTKEQILSFDLMQSTEKRIDLSFLF